MTDQIPHLAELLAQAGHTGDVELSAEQQAYLDELLESAAEFWPHETPARRRALCYFMALTHQNFSPRSPAAAEPAAAIPQPAAAAEKLEPAADRPDPSAEMLREIRADLRRGLYLVLAAQRRFSAAAAPQPPENREETGLGDDFHRGGATQISPPEPDAAKEQETAELLRDIHGFLASSPGAQLATRAVEILAHLRILAWVMACLIALAILAGQLRGQVIVRLKNAGTTLQTQAGGLVAWNCGTNLSCTWDAATHTFNMTSSATAGTAWSSLTAPTVNLSMSMGAFSTTFTHSAATGAGVNLWTWTDSLNNTGTGILGRFTTASGSALTPWQADANGAGVKVDTAGVVRAIGTGGIDAAAITLGTLALGRVPSQVVRTDQGATLGAFTYDFTSSTLKVPNSAGAAPSVSATIAYDTTANFFKGGANGSTITFAAAASCAANNYATATTGSGITCAQPAFSQLTGTATKAQLPATTVFTDQANTYSSGAQDFTAVTTRTIQTGTTAARPATCTANKDFYNVTDPATAGQQVYVCNATGNGWNLVGDGGAGGGTAPWVQIDWQKQATAVTVTTTETNIFSTAAATVGTGGAGKCARVTVGWQADAGNYTMRVYLGATGWDWVGAAFSSASIQQAHFLICNNPGSQVLQQYTITDHTLGTANSSGAPKNLTTPAETWSGNLQIKFTATKDVGSGTITPLWWLLEKQT